MPLLLKILGVKVVGTAISLIVLLTKTGPSFTPITLLHENETIFIETSLKKAFSKGLDEIIMSGTEVGIIYTCTLLERDQDGFISPLYEKTIYQYILYDPVRDSFWVKKEQHSQMPGHALDSVQQTIVLLSVPMISIHSVTPEKDYAIKIVASLNTIEIEAIEADDFDLNAFWNFKYPSAVTEWLSGEELRSP